MLSGGVPAVIYAAETSVGMHGKKNTDVSPVYHVAEKNIRKNPAGIECRRYLRGCGAGVSAPGHVEVVGAPAEHDAHQLLPLGGEVALCLLRLAARRLGRLGRHCTELGQDDFLQGKEGTEQRARRSASLPFSCPKGGWTTKTHSKGRYSKGRLENK